MSSTFVGFAVTLEKEISEERAEAIRAALYQLRGVVDVRPIPHSGLDMALCETRVRREIAEKLIGMAREVVK